MDIDEPNERYLVFFDLETGGLDPSRHAIIQLAAIAVDSKLQPVEAFEAKVKFQKSQACKNSLRKNHYSHAVWAKEASEPKKVAYDFATFLTRYPAQMSTSRNGKPYPVAQLVAHNAAFDGPFIQRWYERLGYFIPAKLQVLCTLQRAQWYFNEHRDHPRPANLQLATLCEHFKVPFHAGSAHEALADVTATLLLYRAMRQADWLHE